MKVLSVISILVLVAAILESTEAACDVCGSCIDCGAHGTCAVSFDTAVCYCAPGWRGMTCNQIDPDYQEPVVSSPCDPNPCENNGHCSPYNDSYYCSCAAYYTGDNCEQSTTQNPCQLAAENGDPCPGQQCQWYNGGGYYCA